MYKKELEKMYAATSLRYQKLQKSIEELSREKDRMETHVKRIAARYILYSGILTLIPWCITSSHNALLTAYKSRTDMDIYSRVEEELYCIVPDNPLSVDCALVYKKDEQDNEIPLVRVCIDDGEIRLYSHRWKDMAAFIIEQKLTIQSGDLNSIEKGLQQSVCDFNEDISAIANLKKHFYDSGMDIETGYTDNLISLCKKK